MERVIDPCRNAPSTPFVGVFNAGVCLAARWGRGRYRGYFRSQLLLALLVSKLVKQGYRLNRIREDLGLEARPPEAADLVAVAEALADQQVYATG